MKHPSESTLALHAGDDLGLVARWRVRRHLAGCGHCREEVSAFRAMRQIAPDLAETPEIPWNRLAAEMKANIRLGLAAGECVRNEASRAHLRPVAGFRPAVAAACLVVLVAAGVLIERPHPRPQAALEDGIVVEHTPQGIQVQEGGLGFGLLHSGVRDAREVTYTVSAQGAMRARYVDPETGNVTINNVYAE